jgi:hypothetical protein
MHLDDVRVCYNQRGGRQRRAQSARINREHHARSKARRCACVRTFAHRSKVLLNALSSACDHSIISDFTLTAPTEWLQSWVPSCIHEAEPLSSEEIRMLVNSLQKGILQLPRQKGVLSCRNCVPFRQKSAILEFLCEDRLIVLQDSHTLFLSRPFVSSSRSILASKHYQLCNEHCELIAGC